VRVHLRKEARVELAAIAAYYGGEGAELRLRFLARIDEVLQRLSSFPRAAPVVLSGARRALVPGFPYGVFYRVQGDAVQVLAVLHLHRAPSTWQRRVQVDPEDD
jgi:plasmid stabilization system protein ParE